MRRLGLACATLTALTACTGAPTPIEPTATAIRSSGALSPSNASTLKPPTLPAAAKRNDETGAANFVAYWVKASNYSARTGDTDLLRSISEPDCGGCFRYIDLYEATYKRGGSFEGGDNELREVAAQPGEAGVYISGILVAAPGHYILRKDAPRKASPVESTKVTFLAHFVDKEWVMVDVGLTGS